ncbi:uncharacterized protein LOC123665925 [Melitaea cinxia]|uniref:uncharacterized protein LOC123665925 n=1 Tax=Melitaea cinxia TaxID=113334 RepID=UPI001E273503|nr:uncharacterized protein LOC123665925 [Melitaea cinxia]
MDYDSLCYPLWILLCIDLLLFAMGSRVKPTRIMCVNCRLCVNKLRRYTALALDTRVTAIICSWVYPQIILEDDYVCEPCRDLAIAAVNNNLQNEVPGNLEAGSSTSRGHRNVCLLCGCSILRRQSDKILKESPNEMQQTIITIIASKLAPREITPSDRVCHACWLRTKREAVRMNNQDENRQPLIEITDNEQQKQSRPAPAEIPQSELTSTVETQRIVLPDYRRAANSTHTCVFPNCSSNTLHNISDKLRATILHNHKYYLPKLARVCSEHLSINLWHTLYDSENSIQTFTVDQIQHVFSFVNQFNPSLDFESLQDMDERLFQYWIGLTKIKFNNLIEEVPHI